MLLMQQLGVLDLIQAIEVTNGDSLWLSDSVFCS